MKRLRFSCFMELPERALDASGDVSTELFATSDVKSEQIRSEALRICQLYVGQQWNDLKCSDVALERLSGMTNYVFKVSNRNPQVKVDPLLLRIHGSVGHELVIETVTASILAERNYGPQLFGIFPEGRLEEFVEAKELQLCDLYCEDMSAKIARKAAQFHGLSIPVLKCQWLLLQTAKDYFSLLPSIKPRNETETTAKKFIESFDYEKEIEFLKMQLSTSKSPIVFCHNDLQEGNILSRVDNKQLLFIDYEYSCYNYRNFDLVNHFLEWTANYAVDDSPFFEFIPARFPSRAQLMHFLSEYFSTSSQLKGGQLQQDGETEEEAMERACQEVIDEIDLFSCYSHLFWSSWGICVKYHLAPGSANDLTFGYLEYTMKRLQLYNEAKLKLLSTT